MNSTISAFEAANTPLTQLLDTVRIDQWDSPSPCEGWTVRNVVGHLMETQREFLGRNNIDIGKVADAAGIPLPPGDHTAQRCWTPSVLKQ